MDAPERLSGPSRAGTPPADLRFITAAAFLASLYWWGIWLLPSVTIAPSINVPSIHTGCRVGGAQFKCQDSYQASFYVDAGAPTWVEMAAEYYVAANGHTAWNPYIGSGYPIVFDGMSSRYSPYRWLLIWFPGEGGHDFVIWLRAFLFTLGIGLAAAFAGAGSSAAILAVAIAPVTPYLANYIDIVFLDTDLLAPWFMAIVLGAQAGVFSWRLAFLFSGALAFLIGLLGFHQSQVVFFANALLVTLAAALPTRYKSFGTFGAAGAGFALAAFSWAPLLSHLGEFMTSRSVDACIATQGVTLARFEHTLFQSWLGQHEWSPSIVGTAAGLLLLPASALAKRSWPTVAFLFAAALVIFGPPALICSLPGISGVRFYRHGMAYVQGFFLIASAIALTRLARLSGRTLQFVTGATCIVTLLTQARNPVAPDTIDFLPVVILLSLALGWCASRFSRWKPMLGPIAVGLAALTPLATSNGYVPRLFSHLWPIQVSVDPRSDSPYRLLGEVSRAEDRRHFSPSQLLYPNWSAAFGILDLRLVAALYVTRYHELNAYLSDKWVRDPGHKLTPDRFVGPVPEEAATSERFQRVLILNRVSLFSFIPGRLIFTAFGPYSRAACHVVTENGEVAMYRCPDIGGIGFFPKRVIARSGRDAILGLLDSTSLHDLIDIAVLDGPTPVATAKGEIASIERWRDRLVYSLKVSEAGLFVIADTYFTGWRATINGAPGEILSVNWAFKGVMVPTGNVVVDLRFDP